jgi:hypothetical protein
MGIALCDTITYSRAMSDRPDSSAEMLRGRFDRLGVLISGLCMVHCVAGLFLIGVLGLGGGVLLNPAIHRFGLVAAFIVGRFTIGAGALRHGSAVTSRSVADNGSAVGLLASRMRTASHASSSRCTARAARCGLSGFSVTSATP